MNLTSDDIGKLFILDARHPNSCLVRLLKSYGQHFCRVIAVADPEATEWDVRIARLSPVKNSATGCLERNERDDEIKS